MLNSASSQKNGLRRMAFAKLQTNRVNDRTKSARDAAFVQVFEGCEVRRYQGQNGSAHILDRECGIDGCVLTSRGTRFYFQEKVREYKWFDRPSGPDFTQEISNGTRTGEREPGEWDHLAAQLYLYCWESMSHGELAAWLLLDITHYKFLVDFRGGIEQMGPSLKNSKHGAAGFVPFPAGRLSAAVICCSGLNRWLPPCLDVSFKNYWKAMSIVPNQLQEFRTKQMSLYSV